MTILGALLLNPDHALLWTDTEIWSDRNRIISRESKLEVNTSLCAIGCGTGSSYLLDCADRALRKCIDAARLPDQIAAALRTGLSVQASKNARKPQGAELRCDLYYAAVWSPEFGRVLIWEMDYARYFEPVLATRAYSPPVDVSELWTPRDQAEIVMAARKQMATFRTKDARAGECGPLTIGEVRRGSVLVHAVADFDADPTTRADAAPPDMTDDAAVAAQTEIEEMQDVH